MVETRRSSSSSKRPLSSPLPNGKRSKAAEDSSSTTDKPCEPPQPPAETLAKDSGCENQAQEEARSSDPPLGVEKSPDAEVKGEPLAFLGDDTTDAEKSKTVPSSALNRAKKRQLKPHAKVVWGKLLSQFSQLEVQSKTVDEGGQRSKFICFTPPL